MEEGSKIDEGPADIGGKTTDNTSKEDDLTSKKITKRKKEEFSRL